MSSEVIDLHICICIHSNHCLYLYTHRLRAAAALPPTQFSGRVDLFSPVCYCTMRSHVTASVFKLGARFLDTFHVRRCWIKIDRALNLEREAELGVHTVSAVGDTTDEDRWVDLLCCLSCCDTAESCLMNNTLTTFSSSSYCYDDWRQLSSIVRCPAYDTSSPFHRCRLLRSCHNASAAQRLLLAASYIFLVTFSVLYYATDSFFPTVPLSISLDTALSHNYWITPVIKVTFWFLLIISRFPHRLTAE